MPLYQSHNSIYSPQPQHRSGISHQSILQHTVQTTHRKIPMLGDHTSVQITFSQNWSQSKPATWCPIPRIVYHSAIQKPISLLLHKFLKITTQSTPQEKMERYDQLGWIVWFEWLSEFLLCTLDDTKKLIFTIFTPMKNLRSNSTHPHSMLNLSPSPTTTSKITSRLQQKKSIKHFLRLTGKSS